MEECCTNSGVPDGCLGMCMAKSSDYREVNLLDKGYGVLGECGNHFQAIVQCRWTGEGIFSIYTT